MTKPAQKEWCVYTGGWYSLSETTVDHIIPLTIGGHDAFVIRASEQGNEYVSRHLDEKFAKHPFVANLRRLRGLRGRRGEIPKMSCLRKFVRYLPRWIGRPEILSSEHTEAKVCIRSTFARS